MLVIVGADQVTNPKPAPDTFLLAAEKLGVKPEHCLVFEDAVSGVKAAVAAGASCIGISAPEKTSLLLEAGACGVIPNFLALDQERSMFCIEPGRIKVKTEN